jgi:cytochrome c-type biogenesis protein CcmE
MTKARFLSNISKTPDYRGFQAASVWCDNVRVKRNKFWQFGIAIAIIVLSLSYLAFTGVQESKSYYVTLSELQKMGDGAYSKRLRVAGNVKPGSIERHGAGADFVLIEQGKESHVSYKGAEPPPDTFKDDAQALAEGNMGKDGVFHAKALQAKCASKYAPQQNGKPGQPTNTASSAMGQ